jgi:hypothetical protein
MSETTAAISLRPTTATSKWLGCPCPNCEKSIAPGEGAVLCPKCFTPHHATCWRDNGNACAKDGAVARILEPRGRAGAPAAVATDSPAPATAPVAALPVPDATATISAADAPLVELANPWKSARVVQGPNEVEIFRRSVMSIVTLLMLWGVAVFIATLLGVV